MRIAHLADLHLGYRAYHRSTSSGINAREADVAKAFDQAVDKIIAEQPDLVVVAGDIFHTSRPSNSAIAQAFRQFSRLANSLGETVPVVLVAGNHDSPRTADTENILNLLGQIPGVHVVERGSERLTFEQLDLGLLCVTDNWLTNQQEVTLDPDPECKHNVLLLHGTVGGEEAKAQIEFLEQFQGDVIKAEDIGPERWDYVALGHYHLVTRLADNMWYSGSIERTATNIWAEVDRPKGFLIYDTDMKAADFVELDVRPVVDLPRQSAKGMTAEEVDMLVGIIVDRIPGGVEDKIVRLVVEDLPRSVVREMDHQIIRDYKNSALHFQFEARPPKREKLGGGVVTRDEDGGLAKMSVTEEVGAYIEEKWTPSSEKVLKKRLTELAEYYMGQAQGDN